MKKEKVVFLVDSFVDANGDTRNFVLAALSEPFEEGEVCVAETDFDFCDEEEIYVLTEMAKGVRLGYAICSPTDKFDEELGMTIALGRARKNAEYALVASRPGYINNPIVEAFLKQEATYLKENPEYYIAGYHRMIARAKKGV